MRFSGILTDDGKSRLEKRFLPTLDKFGKSIQVLLDEEGCYFIQTPLNTEGPCANVKFQADALFHASSYVVSSKYHNIIAFNTDLGLLLKVLRSLSTNAADASVAVKLIQKPVSVPGEAQEVVRPFLSFTARSPNITLCQDLPISKPYVAAEIERLIAIKDVATLAPYYLDMLTCAQDLQAMIDKMKSISDTITLSLCKSGDLFADVSGVNVQLGVQAQGLPVFPATVAPSKEPNRQLPVRQQLSEAAEAGDAETVELPIKHLIKVLQVHGISQPSQILLGVGDQQQLLHVWFVYPSLSNPDVRYDDTVALDFKLPVCDQE